MSESARSTWLGVASTYLFQVVNLGVSVVMLSLMLRFLTQEDYAIYAVFLTFGGLTLTAGNAMQMLSIQELARALSTGSAVAESLSKVISACVLLCSFIAIPLFIGGAVYLQLTDAQHALLAWALFCSAYLIAYAITPRLVLLTARGKITNVNLINLITRLFYFGGVVTFLVTGWGLAGICFAFLLSGGLGIFLTRGYPPALRSGAFSFRLSPELFGYVLYAACAFSLYNSSVLFVRASASINDAASHALALQLSWLLLTVSLAPLPALLSRIHQGLAAGNARQQFFISLLITNTVFVVGAVFLLFLGEKALSLIRSNVMTPDIFFWVLLAFFVEVNIATAANLLMAAGIFRFKRVYFLSAGGGLMLGLLAFYLSSQAVFLIVIPLITQTLVSLPVIFGSALRVSVR